MDFQRGLTPEQILYIRENQGLKKLMQKEELFFGIRNEYFNLYYRGASIGKFYWLRDGRLQIETHPKYLDESGERNKRITLETLLTQYSAILRDVEAVQSAGGWGEKIAQQALLLANNRNPDSGWYCVDMEYVQEQANKADPSYGRFDLTAVSRRPNEQGRYRVALIELKVGYGSYSSDLPETVKTQVDQGEFFLFSCRESLGSGIVGHLADFRRFEAASQFNKLKEELCTILSNKRKIGFKIPCPALQPDDFEERPHFYFLTLWTKKNTLPSCKDSMYHHLGVAGRGRLAAYHAQRVLGSTFLNQENYHFLFAPEDMGGREMVDILGEEDIEAL